MKSIRFLRYKYKTKKAPFPPHPSPHKRLAPAIFAVSPPFSPRRCCVVAPPLLSWRRRCFYGAAAEGGGQSSCAATPRCSAAAVAVSFPAKFERSENFSQLLCWKQISNSPEMKREPSVQPRSSGKSLPCIVVGRKRPKQGQTKAEKLQRLGKNSPSSISFMPPPSPRDQKDAIPAVAS